jgi:hypothetical protein
VGSTSSGVVDFVFAPAAVNYAAGRYVYEVGVLVDSVPRTYRQGVFQIWESAIGAGVAAVTWTTNADWNLYAWRNLPDWQTAAGVTGIVSGMTGSLADNTARSNTAALSTALTAETNRAIVAEAGLSASIAGVNVTATNALAQAQGAFKTDVAESLALGVHTDVGQYALSFGDTVNVGSYAVAFGDLITTVGEKSFAQGISLSAGAFSFVHGSDHHVGIGSYAFGYSTTLGDREFSWNSNPDYAFTGHGSGSFSVHATNGFHLTGGAMTLSNGTVFADGVYTVTGVQWKAVSFAPPGSTNTYVLRLEVKP